MMTRTFARWTTLAAGLMLAAGCGFQHSSTSLAPTPANATSAAPSYIGTWLSSALPGLPSASTCGNLEWRVTSQTATSIAGDFSGVCAGNITISGSATGGLGGATMPLSAAGTATTPGVPSCNFSLTGTGTPQGPDAISIEYSGTTCLGPVHGTETIRRA